MSEERRSIGGRKVNSAGQVDIETALFVVESEVLSHLLSLDRICHEDVFRSVDRAVAPLVIEVYLEWIGGSIGSAEIFGPDTAALTPMRAKFHGRYLKVAERKAIDSALGAVEGTVRPHLDELRRIHDESFLPMVAADLADQANRLFMENISEFLRTASELWLNSDSDGAER